MRKIASRLLLKAMSARYDYDVSYMEHMLDAAPKAFEKFAKLFALAQHRESAPAEALVAAKLVGAMAEDCGPCTQLVVNFAKEQRVAPSDVEAVLRRDPGAMSEGAALGFRFAEAIVYRLTGEDDVREAVRAAWGDKGVIDLTLALQIGRLFPMVKAGLGYAKECRRVEVAGREVDVVKRAA
ncbi:MAG: hypothetical protein HXY28_03665 [Hydrogenophilaceae bacterium]|jgi:hypothetical protein|nr:hypothetical protein [Hydrogenophilaceae bacterium]